ncbi:MAG: hypothetical protein ABI145_12615 [Steroidobacteraceae bacterium]
MQDQSAFSTPLHDTSGIRWFGLTVGTPDPQGTLFPLQQAAGWTFVAAWRQPGEMRLSLCDCRRLNCEYISRLFVLVFRTLNTRLGGKMRDVKRWKNPERMVYNVRPGISLQGHAQARQQKKFARPRGCDVPESYTLALRFCFFRIPRGFVTSGRDTKDRAVRVHLLQHLTRADLAKATTNLETLSSN